MLRMGVLYPFPKHWQYRVLHYLLPVGRTGSAVCEQKKVWEYD